MAKAAATRRARRGGGAGFTLLELLLVLGVVGVALAAALPYLPRSAEAASVRSAAGGIAGGLREARGLAVATGRPADFTVDVAERRWSVKDARDGALPREVTLTLHTDRRLLSSAEIGSIRFFPDGSATGGRLALRRGGSRLTVVVDWLTGAVTIDE